MIFDHLLRALYDRSGSALKRKKLAVSQPSIKSSSKINQKVTWRAKLLIAVLPPWGNRNVPGTY
jgi:hypothetical protein